MKKTVLLIILLALLSACQTQAAEIEIGEDGAYWPTNGWLTAEPKEMGLDPTRLDAMFDFIEAEQINLHGIVIIKDGYIVAEQYYDRYDQNKPHIQYSVTKSFISSLVGIALEEGAIESLDQTLGDFFPDYTFLEAETAEITLENILTMRTGLGWVEGNPGYVGLLSAQDGVEYMIELPMVDEPGNDFRYCSGCSFLLSAIVQQTTGQNTADYAQEKLFSPLGIEKPTWETVRDGTPNGGWGLYLTPRQMAKFGYLYLHEGQWDNEQLVPREWVTASTAPGREVNRDVDYGYQWWIFPEDGIFAAQGMEGQKIFVIPAHNMIVVMAAELADDSVQFKLLADYILPAIMNQTP